MGQFVTLSVFSCSVGNTPALQNKQNEPLVRYFGPVCLRYCGTYRHPLERRSFGSCWICRSFGSCWIRRSPPSRRSHCRSRRHLSSRSPRDSSQGSRHHYHPQTRSRHHQTSPLGTNHLRLRHTTQILKPAIPDFKIAVPTALKGTQTVNAPIVKVIPLSGRSKELPLSDITTPTLSPNPLFITLLSLMPVITPPPSLPWPSLTMLKSRNLS